MSRGTTRFIKAAVAGALLAAALPASASADLTGARHQVWQQGVNEIDGAQEEQLRLPTAYAGVYRQRGDAFGQAVAVGDFNDDGLEDLAIGAPDEDAPMANMEENAEYSRVPAGNGAVTVIYGSYSQRGLGQRAHVDQLFHPGNDGVAETGTANPGSQEFGYALATGDFNHDGKDDLAIGVPGNGGGGVVILYGQNPADHRVGLGTAGAQYLSQDSPGIAGGAETGDRFGASLAVGDFDAGGVDDLAIGVPFEDDQAGAVNVVHGGSAGLVAANGNLMWDQNTPGIHGGAEGSADNCSPVICQDMEGDRFGHSLAAGDFNANGYDDLAIGVPYEITEQGQVGSVSVIYAGEWGLRSAGNQDWHQNSPGVEGGSEGGDLFGWALAAGKFTNFRGVDSLAIGAPGEDSDSGAVNVIYGSTVSGLAADVLADQMWYQDSPGIHGASESGDGFGRSLAAGMFKERPGLDALAIGVPFEDGGAGAVAVLYPESAAISWLRADGNQLWQQGNGMAGSAEGGDQLGYALATGDFDRNGADDLAAGARWENNTAGAVNVNYAADPGGTDSTPPEIVPSVEGPVGNGGWYTGDVTVRFTATDPESPLDGTSGDCAPIRITTDGTRTLTCRAWSRGGIGEHTVTIKRDATAPTIRGTRDEANEHGWNNSYVSVDFACSDAGSGVESCTPGSTVTTEGANQIARGRAVDRAGNVAYDEIRNINIDRTSPMVVADVVQEPNAAGWHTTDVAVEYTCTDAVSAVDRCSPAETLTRDGANQIAIGRAVDLAGNAMITDTGYINIDKTAPVVQVVRTPAPNKAGWNRTDVRLAFVCSDATSGLPEACPDDVAFGKEGAGQSLRRKVFDIAGNLADVRINNVSIDKTPPKITATRRPAPDGPGNEIVSFSCSDDLSQIATCPADELLIAGGKPVHGEAVDAAGNSAALEVG